MYFTTLLVLSCLLALWMAFNLLKIRKHDRVLFQFCQLRRDIMDLLRTRGFNLPKNEYLIVRGILGTVNKAIHGYNDHKTSFFNFRSFARFLREFKRNASAAERLPAPRDPEVREIASGFEKAMRRGFLTYTPFIRSELGLRLLVILSFLLAKAGLKSVQQIFENLSWAESHIKRA